MWLRQPRLNLTKSKHLWATPPHYHYGHSVIISTSELATSRSTRSLLHTHTHTTLPPTAGMVVTTQNLQHKCITRPRTATTTSPMWENPASITQTIYLPAMCHPKKPTKTHSCTGWEQTTPAAKQSHVDVIPQINDVSNHH